MNNNFILNRVFSQKTINDMLLYGSSDVLETAYKKYISADISVDNKDKFQSLYKVLEKTQIVK